MIHRLATCVRCRRVLKRAMSNTQSLTSFLILIFELVMFLDVLKNIIHSIIGVTMATEGETRIKHNIVNWGRNTWVNCRALAQLYKQDFVRKRRSPVAREGTCICYRLALPRSTDIVLILFRSMVASTAYWWRRKTVNFHGHGMYWLLDFWDAPASESSIPK